jgi:hypothetical protein
MVTRAKDLSNKVFGRLTVISRSFDKESSNGCAFWICKCECGNERIVRTQNLNSGKAKSCGCLHNENFVKMNTKHGLADHPIYRAWQNMVHRCNNTNHANYHCYGARGITVCNEWLSVENFVKFAESNGYKPGLQIDRLDSNGNYEPSNVVFSTPQRNSNNKREEFHCLYEGKTAADWARELSLNYGTVNKRIHRGVAPWGN